MAKAPINVSIAGDYNDKDINRAIRDLNSLQTGGGSTTTAMSVLSNGMKALGGVMAATFSVALITDFFSSSISAALADEKAMKSLEIALGNVGAAHQVGAVETFIDALARETGVADDMLRPAFQKLVTATGNVALSQKAVALAMDISAGTGRDLEAVSLALAKGFSGSTTALGKLGAGIDANIIKSKDMDAITAALSQKFAGQAAAAAETYQGKIDRISVAVGEAKELIGKALLDAVVNVSDSFGGVGGLTDNIDKASVRIANIIQGLGILADRLIDTRDATGAGATEISFYDKEMQNLDRVLPNPITLINLVGDELEKMALSAQQAAFDASGFHMEMTKGRLAALGFKNTLPGLTDAVQETDDAAVKASFSFISLYESIVAARRATSDLGNTSGTVTSAIAEGVATGGVPEYYKNLTLAYGEAADKLDKVGSGASTAAKETFTFKEALAAVNESGLQQLNANLKAAQDEFDGFRKSVGAGISGQLDFGSAIDAAKEGGTGIVAGIASQADGIVAFGEQLLALLETSLSEESFLAVAALSAERGAALATELLGANGAALIAQLDSSVLAVNAIADAVALESATKFKGAGVITAEATIAGFQEYMGKDGMGRARLMKTMDNLAEAATRQVRIDVLVTRSINEVVTRITQNISGPQARAEGGPVSAGRSYMVGEAGPELFTPSRSGSITPNSAMGGSTYNINVTAGVGDPRAIGQQVVEYIKKFEKANGPVFTAA